MWQSLGQEHFPPRLPENPCERQALHMCQVQENLQQEVQRATPEEDARLIEGQGILESTHYYWKVLRPWASAILTF